MKKGLLFISVLFLFGTLKAADKVWDFTSIFTEDKSLDAGKVTIVDGELLAVSSSFAVDNTASTSMKKWTTGSTYHTRLKTGGSGAVATANCLAIKVAGNSTIQVCAVSSSSTAGVAGTRKLEVSTANGTVIGSVLVDGNAGKDATIAPPTFTYTGNATVIYIYSAKNVVDAATDGYTAGGLNLYMVSATNTSAITVDDIVISSVTSIFADKGIIFNGQTVSNPNNVTLEVYNVLGKLVTRSNQDINTADYVKGIYIVKAEGENGALKFTK